MGPNEGRAVALCVRVAGRGLSQLFLPKPPRAPVFQPTSPATLAWLSTGLRADPALSPDACYLHTHLWTNGWPAGSWSPPPGGGLLSGCVWQFGLEPKVGGLTVEEACPAPPLRLSTPEQHCSDIPFTGQESRPGNSSCPTTPHSLAFVASLQCE